MIHWEWFQKFKSNHAYKWYMYNPEFILKNEMQKYLWDIEEQTDHLISARRPNQQIKKRTCRRVDFAVPADHRVKLKENEKSNKYLELIWELKKLWIMKVTGIPIVTGVLGTITKILILVVEDLGIRGQKGTIHTTALLKPARILWRVLETWENFLSLRLLRESIIIIIIIIRKGFSKVCCDRVEQRCATILLRILTLSLSLSPFSFPLPPRHHIIDKVLRHHIIVNIFRRNKIGRNFFPLHRSLFLSFQLTKTISTFKIKTSLLKPDTFDCKLFNSSCYTDTLSIIKLISPFAYKLKKKNWAKGFSLKMFLGIKSTKLLTS